MRYRLEYRFIETRSARVLWNSAGEKKPLKYWINSNFVSWNKNMIRHLKILIKLITIHSIECNRMCYSQFIVKLKCLAWSWLKMTAQINHMINKWWRTKVNNILMTSHANWNDRGTETDTKNIILFSQCCSYGKNMIIQF